METKDFAAVSVGFWVAVCLDAATKPTPAQADAAAKKHHREVMAAVGHAAKRLDLVTVVASKEGLSLDDDFGVGELSRLYAMLGDSLAHDLAGIEVLGVQVDDGEPTRRCRVEFNDDPDDDENYCTCAIYFKVHVLVDRMGEIVKEFSAGENMLGLYSADDLSEVA